MKMINNNTTTYNYFTCYCKLALEAPAPNCSNNAGPYTIPNIKNPCYELITLAMHTQFKRDNIGETIDMNLQIH